MQKYIEKGPFYILVQLAINKIILLLNNVYINTGANGYLFVNKAFAKQLTNQLGFRKIKVLDATLTQTYLRPGKNFNILLESDI